MATCRLKLPVIIFLSPMDIFLSGTSDCAHVFTSIESEVVSFTNHSAASTSPIHPLAAFEKLELRDTSLLKLDPRL